MEKGANLTIDPPRAPEYPKAMTVNAQYAAEHFEDLASAADKGEQVEIERPGKPTLVLVSRPAGRPTPSRRPAASFGARGKDWSRLHPNRLSGSRPHKRKCRVPHPRRAFFARQGGYRSRQQTASLVEPGAVSSETHSCFARHPRLRSAIPFSVLT